jgi:hypothetical protein
VGAVRCRRRLAAVQDVHWLPKGHLAWFILDVTDQLDLQPLYRAPRRRLRTAVHEAGKVRAGQSCWAFIRRSKSPELPVVLLEDVGALLGLGCALAG